MKQCRYCNKYYPESHFGVARTTETKVYRRHKCRACYRTTKQILQERYRKWFTDYKKKKRCERCGFKDHRALDFHHLTTKAFTIGDQAYYHYNPDRVKKEMEKCIILCANCHRILHEEQRNGKKHIMQKGKLHISHGV